MTDPTQGGSTSNLAKIFGWVQFGVQTAAQVLATGVPTGVGGWLGLVASLAAAVGIHLSAKTDGSK